ncbi:MAG TPA: hypothetical protein VFS92_04850, partial [Planctomycetota bacterium]|nr:hypothetical protein [Planctomycetota bacterium]
MSAAPAQASSSGSGSPREPDKSPRTPVRIAVDALGGDHAPKAVVQGVLAALDRQPDVAVTLVGDR